MRLTDPEPNGIHQKQEGQAHGADATAANTLKANTLNESEERFRLLVEGATDYAMFLMDAGRHVIHWNAGAERIFGYTEAEMIGQSGDIIFTPEDRDLGEPQKEADQAVASGRAEDKRWHVRKDGSRFWANGVLTVLREEQLRGFAKILRDETKEKHARDELEQCVAERTSELKQTNEALRAEAAQRRQVEKARQRLLQQLVTVQEEERLRIARELHDQIGQRLTALLLGLQSLPDLPEIGLSPPSLNRRIMQLETITEGLMQQVHRLAWELRPSVLDDLGLEAALQRYVEEWSERCGIAADFISSKLNAQRFSPHIEITIYRVVQEALTNVERHAGARHVSILLEVLDGNAQAVVEDDGVGFDPDMAEQESSRLGLLGMYERVDLAGGTLTIESAPGSGTTVFIRLPLERRRSPRS